MEMSRDGDFDFAFGLQKIHSLRSDTNEIEAMKKYPDISAIGE
jgi:hypothetical protein